MSGFSVVAYEPRHRAALFALMDSVWEGEWLTEPEFDWWSERNPAGTPTLTVAELDGRVVGAAALAYARVLVDGEQVLLPLAQQVATHPDARGRGIFEALARENDRRALERGATLELAFPNDTVFPLFVRKLGWQVLPPVRIWARPLRPLGLAAARLGRRRADRPALRPRSAAPVRRGGLEIQAVERFPPDADELGRAASASDGSRILRSAAYLNWRFADAPRDYRLFTATRDDRLAGAAVVGGKAIRGAAVAFVADLLASPDEPRAARLLVRRALREARGAADLVLAAPLRGQRAAYLASGFVPTPLTIAVGGKSLPEGPLPPAAQEWQFTLGDTDFF